VVVLGDTGRGPTTVSLPIPQELSAVLFVPSFSMPTKRARALRPDLVPRRDAIFNSSRTALLVAALQTGRLELLRLATQDRLHQPYRTKLFPALPTLIEAALAAGAHGAALSGAGSAVLALVTGRQSQIGQAMKEAALRRGVHGRWLAVDVARSGAELVEEG
jgi:homoserine kinase